jgi:hypothetical protein
MEPLSTARRVGTDCRCIMRSTPQLDRIPTTRSRARSPNHFNRVSRTAAATVNAWPNGWQGGAERRYRDSAAERYIRCVEITVSTMLTGKSSTFSGTAMARALIGSGHAFTRFSILTLGTSRVYARLLAADASRQAAA